LTRFGPPAAPEAYLDSEQFRPAPRTACPCRGSLEDAANRL